MFLDKFSFFASRFNNFREKVLSEFDYIYVVPFKGMDAKIAITKLGKIDVLEEYDEIRIKNFIEGR